MPIENPDPRRSTHAYRGPGDEPSQRPIAIVTGANTGVGKETTRELARRGWTVVMVCRSEARGRSALNEMEAEHPGSDLRLELCDLASLDDVRRLAPRLESLPRIEALVNNAGLFRRFHEQTADGFEMTLAVNHLGHFLLTTLLSEKLRRDRSRIVNISSNAHRRARLRRGPISQILRGWDPYSGIVAYGDSKLANVLFTRELARRWGPDGVLTFAVHPGVLATEIWDRNSGLVMKFFQWWKRFMDPPSVGGEAVSKLVYSADVLHLNGGYFNELRHTDASHAGRDDDLAASLWEESARAVAIDGVPAG